MKKLILYLGCIFCTNIAFAQYTQVPDPNFEQALIDLGIDSEGILDGQFLTADAENVELLDIDDRNINSLIGIEAFTSLLWLDAYNNNISEMDLSLISSPEFYTLRLGNNNISEIDLSHIPDILNIGLHGNQISTLDASNLTQAFVLSLAENPLTEIILNNTHLQILEFQGVLLTEIDLSEVQSLQKVYLQDSQIQTLDFSNNPILEEVNTFNTPLTNINLPNNPNLKKLYVGGCQLTQLDITNCSGLLDLECGDNMLTELNLSNNFLLEDITCIDNQLTNLDLSNNPNIFRIWASNNLIADDLAFTNNPLLENLTITDNYFSTLDLSQNTILEYATVGYNPNLEMVNIKNGNNENMFWLSVFNCPNLSCIVVDDPLADNDFITIEQNANISLVASPEECNLSINESELQNLIQVYPNPVKTILHIENSQNINFEKITVFDILGKVVLIEKNNFNQLNLSNLNSGILFLKIQTENGELIKKVIKE